MHACDETGSDTEISRGTIFRKDQGRYHVRAGDRTVVCAISKRLRKRRIYPSADPASVRPHVVAVKDIRGSCRFGGRCAHVHEPGCAIRHAVDTGRIAPQRYRSYATLLREMGEIGALP